MDLNHPRGTLHYYQPSTQLFDLLFKDLTLFILGQNMVDASQIRPIIMEMIACRDTYF